MTYGYRFNAEQVYFKIAEENWLIALEEMKDCQGVDDDGNNAIYLAPRSDEGKIAAVQCVIGWSFCVESFSNLIWNSVIAEQMPTEGLNEHAQKTLSTLEKIKEILRYKDVELGECGWLSGVSQLFKTRNNLAHFKDYIRYVGFSFSPPYLLMFEKKAMTDYRKSAISAIEKLSELSGIGTDFLQGKYELVTVFV